MLRYYTDVYFGFLDLFFCKMPSETLKNDVVKTAKRMEASSLKPSNVSRNKICTNNALCCALKIVLLLIVREVPLMIELFGPVIVQSTDKKKLVSKIFELFIEISSVLFPVAKF